MKLPAADHRYLTIRQAASLIGPDMSPQRMRRRLKILHARHPNLGIIRRPGERWFEVDAEALKRALQNDPHLHEVEIGAMLAKQNQHDLRLHALRKRVRALETRLKSLLAEHEKQP